MVFKFSYLVAFIKGYQPPKLQFCRLSRSSFTEGSQKHNDDVMMTSFQIFWDSKFQYFVKLVISYQPAKFKISELFESNFKEVFIRHPKIPL